MKKTPKSLKIIDAKKSENSSPIITDSDIVFVNGNKDDLLGRFQMHLSKAKEKIRKLFERNKL